MLHYSGSARGGMVGGWGLLGFWRFVVGERSRKHAIARLGPRRPALGVVWGWVRAPGERLCPRRRRRRVGAVRGSGAFTTLRRWPRRSGGALGARCAACRS